MLSLSDAKAYYDKFGKKQDTQAFYEDPATALLIEHARFEDASSVFELGSGTGRFADKLLSSCLASDCEYTGTDISPVMISLAKERLRKYGPRVTLRLSRGSTPLPEGNESYDRFISNYVLDLLSEHDANANLEEAYRILRPGGLLCMVSLASGTTLPTKLISSIWMVIYKINPKLVGGCRPIDLTGLICASKWSTEFVTPVSAFGITSQVVVARKA